MAATAAPTYFTPTTIHDEQSNETDTLIDGGIFANDPTIFVITDLLHRFPNTYFVVVHIGTGKYDVYRKRADEKNWGLLHWASGLIHVMIDANSSQSAKAVSNLADHSKIPQLEYDNFDISIPAELAKLDDYSTANMEQLKNIGLSLTKKQDQKLRIVAHMLTAPPPE